MPFVLRLQIRLWALWKKDVWILLELPTVVVVAGGK
jgi:hypothetical protein